MTLLTRKSNQTILYSVWTSNENIFFFFNFYVANVYFCSVKHVTKCLCTQIALQYLKYNIWLVF